MTDRLRIRIAAVATALFIGSLSLAGIATRHGTVAQQTAAVKTQAVSAEHEAGEIDDE